MAGGCKYPGCNYQGNHRPYAGRGVPSASTIASLVDDGKARSFAWAASLIAAVTAVHHPEEWSGLVDVMSDKTLAAGYSQCSHQKEGLCKACTYLRSEHDRQWTAKANLGTHVHHLALSWATGEEVEEDDTTAPFLDALAGFYQLHQPEWIELERTVLHETPKSSHAYRGQFDGIGIINCPSCLAPKESPARCKWLIDYKTGGYYPIEQTLQLAGYRFANHLTTWDDGTEVVTGPVPAVAHAGVLLLSAEGGFRLVELPANGDAFGTFLRLRDIWGWSRSMEKWVRDHPDLILKSDIPIEGAAA